MCSGGSLKTRLVVWCSNSGDAPYFGNELLVLVGAEGRRVLVDGDDVGVAAEEDAAVGHALDRRVLAQRAVGRVRVVVEAVGQPLQVEVFGEVAVVGHGGKSTVSPTAG